MTSPIEITPADIEGLFIIKSNVYLDDRGSFIKPYSANIFLNHGLETSWQEFFWSTSRRGTIRGLHFQKAPFAQSKIVSCVHGNILDVAVDIRSNSPSYGRHFAVELNDSNGLSLYLPDGFAHGFQALSDHATVCYLCSRPYQPSHDTGFLWNSCGIQWVNIHERFISRRDLQFIPMPHQG